MVTLLMLGGSLVCSDVLPFIVCWCPFVRRVDLLSTTGCGLRRKARWRGRGHRRRYESGCELHAIIIGDSLGNGEQATSPSCLPSCLRLVWRLSWVEVSGDDRARLADTFRRTMAAGDAVFSFGGIGTRPTTTLGRPRPIFLGVARAQCRRRRRSERFGDDMTPQRLQLVTFPASAQIIESLQSHSRLPPGWHLFSSRFHLVAHR